MSTLKPTKKISRRHELRQDTVVTFSARVWQAVDQNRPMAYGLLALVAVVVLGLFAYSYWIRQQEAQGQELLAPVVRLYEAGQYSEALNGSDGNIGLLDIASDYGSTNAGNLAHFYAANALFELGEFDRALDHFEAFEKDANYLGASALAGEAAIYEVRGENERAADLYRRAASIFPNDVAAPEYLVEAGRAYEEAAEFEKAVEAYRAVSEDYPESVQARNVDLLVARAEARQMARS